MHFLLKCFIQLKIVELFLFYLLIIIHVKLVSMHIFLLNFL